MQVRIPIGFDPIVNLNFKLENQNSKKLNQSSYVLNFDYNFNIYGHWIFNTKFECLIMQSCSMNLNYEMSQKI